MNRGAKLTRKVDASVRRAYMAAMHDPFAIIIPSRRRRCRDAARACMRI
jgi:hypothetical protein